MAILTYAEWTRKSGGGDFGEGLGGFRVPGKFCRATLSPGGRAMQRFSCNMIFRFLHAAHCSHPCIEGRKTRSLASNRVADRNVYPTIPLFDSTAAVQCSLFFLRYHAIVIWVHRVHGCLQTLLIQTEWRERRIAEEQLFWKDPSLILARSIRLFSSTTTKTLGSMSSIRW